MTEKMSLRQTFLVWTTVTLLSGQSIRVFKSTDNLKNLKNGSGAKLRDPPDILLRDVTICWRFFQYTIRSQFFISSRDFDWLRQQIPSEYLILFMHGVRKRQHDQFVGFLHQGGFIHVEWEPMRWNHVCFR